MILACGLPRSASRSLAAAMDILGYDSIHFCPLTHNNSYYEYIKNLDCTDNLALVDWTLINNFDECINNFRPSKVILLYRQHKWTESISSFGYSTQAIRDIFAKYQIANMMLNEFYEIPYIKLDLANKPKWDKLCKFLHKDIPTCDFPHLNKSGFNYTI
jgi:hypothetical protein